MVVKQKQPKAGHKHVQKARILNFWVNLFERGSMILHCEF